jgi:hypothetical protein
LIGIRKRTPWKRKEKTKKALKKELEKLGLSKL